MAKLTERQIRDWHCLLSELEEIYHFLAPGGEATHWAEDFEVFIGELEIADDDSGDILLPEWPIIGPINPKEVAWTAIRAAYEKRAEEIVGVLLKAGITELPEPHE